MFAMIKDFVHRHNKKLVLGAATVGSACLINSYSSKRRGISSAETDDVLAKQKKKQHYEKLLITSNTTVLSLSQSLTSIVLDTLDTDSVVEAIKMQPDDKQAHWLRLKILSFSRCVAAIYSVAIVVPVVHCLLMVLGGYSFQNISKSPLTGKVDEITQEKYLSSIKELIENWIPSLIDKIYQQAKKSTENLALDTQLNIDHLEMILKEIVIRLQEDKTLIDFHGFFVASHFSTEDSLLRQMFQETEEVLATDDFEKVVEILSHSGLNHILDRIADLSLTRRPDTTALPLAKIIPFLNGVAAPALSTERNQLLQTVMFNHYVEAFSFNVYECFSSAV